MELWTASKDEKGEFSMHFGRLDMSTHPLLSSARNAWVDQVGEKQFVLEGDEVHEYYQVINDSPEYPLKVSFDKLPDKIFHYDFTFDHGILYAFSLEPLSDAYLTIFHRFSALFEQTYRRYLDLVRAESQAREAQIEAALERVRAKMMAMHKSEELHLVLGIIFEQMNVLGLDPEATSMAIYNEDESSEHWMAGFGHEDLPRSFKVPLCHHPYYQAEVAGWRSGKPFEELFFEGLDKVEFVQWLFDHSEFSELPDEFKKEMLSPKPYYIGNAYMKYGFIERIGVEPIDPETQMLIERFAKVFEQSYTRFLDLQKAEAQAREAQIEAALERVRSKSMAMHSTDGISEVVTVLFDQLKALNIEFIQSWINIFHPEEGYFDMWLSRIEGFEEIPFFTRMPLAPFEDSTFKSWRNGEKYALLSFDGKEKVDEFIGQLGDISKSDYFTRLQSIKNFERLECLNANHKYGTVSMSRDDTIPESDKKILSRFAHVFEQTYTRFLDLQKAEAQAREAQIEMALEHIRARTMAMAKSDELAKVATAVFQQLNDLGMTKEEDRLWFVIINEETGLAKYWMTAKGGAEIARSYDLSLVGLPGQAGRWFKRWKALPANARKDHNIIIKYVGDELVDLLDHLNQSEFREDARWKEIHQERKVEQIIIHDALFSHGSLALQCERLLDEESQAVLQRFSQVFEQTYTRFLDLQKAEAQAREAQIETALERIRARALAMHASNELIDVSMVLREQMAVLGETDLESTIIHLYPEEEAYLEAWYTFRPPDAKEDELVKGRAYVPNDSSEYIRETIANYRKGLPTFTIESRGEKLSEWYNVLEQVAPMTVDYDADGKIVIPEVLYYHYSRFSGGALMTIANDPPSKTVKELQQRAAKEFDLAYQRFLDLQVAEQQAKEAQVEASLERVRARSMAMQSSIELPEVASVIYEELERLGLVQLALSIGIFNRETRDSTWWAFDRSRILSSRGYQVPYFDHPWFEATYKGWEDQMPYFEYELAGQSKKDLDHIMFELTDFRDLPEESKQSYISMETMQVSYITITHGVVELISDDPLTGDQIEILQRISKVIDFTYTRMEDLRQSEARAVEARERASLDKVRAEIASMRSSSDLEHITPLIWQELNVLEIPFFRCGVFIIDEEATIVHTFLSSPSGESLAVMHLEFDSHPLLRALIDAWKNREVYSDIWTEEDFISWAESLHATGHIENTSSYMGGEKMPSELYLKYFPFDQGMLYVGSDRDISEGQRRVVQNLANAMSVAYARYEDFIQLEEAKGKAEEALAELKEAQTQLIHSEKMASLGELTAGIAHEIQNPLNFVNNFSEVSGELIDELEEEFKAGDEEEVTYLLTNLKENLTKIHHHGQRASSIVKGMLDHSRASSDQKEWTDINALCDEYLRLAYHGLRAKDRSFQSAYTMELQENLPQMHVVPQDIGRVILNLINNAFYAVSTKSKEEKGQLGKESSSYKPEVIVRTEARGDEILISVQDNGNGIPKNILGKIFQPFFTTKPTGEGTGLGLSLSYDIIKAHGGDMSVESELGAGTIFRITLSKDESIE
jgi:signal transduction histidine kinase